MSTHATIDDLPNELLEEIFDIAVLTSGPNPGCAVSRRKTTMAISHVNKDWRHISHHLSSVWAYSIDASMSSEGIEEFVRRAGNRNLVVSMDGLIQNMRQTHVYDEDEERWIAKEDSNEDPRTFFWSGQWRSLQKTRALTRCEELSIVLLDKDRTHTWSFEKYVNRYGVRSLSVVSGLSPTTFYLPNLGNYGTRSSFSEKLQTLRLRGCIMDLAGCADSLVKLEHLSVQEVPVEYGYEPRSWLRILERLPSLKSLTLKNGFGEKLVSYGSRPGCETGSLVSSTSSPKLKCFQLPHLRSVLVEEDTDDISSFFRWLDLHSQCAIVISMRNYMPTHAVKVQHLLCRFSQRHIRPDALSRKFSIEMGKSCIELSSASTFKHSNASFRLSIYWSRNTERYAGWANSAKDLEIILAEGLGKTVDEVAAFIQVRMDQHDQKNKSRVLNLIQCIQSSSSSSSAQLDNY
ncbi:hypothetical protein CVT24_011298 [Panaeolus cyanescens]|uniref:F-box domain-containing protein n=1 Tax=Panaeolus cyanescens TaxID=181874 RepID=A0A409YUT7_9AGAR|nr:hypothetical protein CVT24_011298 [Panaeolus cyanescens]